MNDLVRQALETDRVIDITTIGRKTGQPRRKEIWFYNVEGRIFITGSPGMRGWYANMLANPRFTFHLKRSVQVDLPAKATPIRDEAQRREILASIRRKLDSDLGSLEAMAKGSPLVEVHLG